jgi:DNA-binding NtrC family response regulator
MEKDPQKTILVIEDDQGVLATIVKHLSHAGFQVMTAADGLEGLKKIKAGGYDLVITDIVMPFISGTGVVTSLKELNPNIPVIAITGYGPEPEAVAIEKKADLVLPKPMKMTKLKTHISKLLTASNVTENNNKQ